MIFFKYLHEFSIHFVLLLLFCLLLTFFSPIYSTAYLQGFLDIFAIFSVFTTIFFIVKFIVQALNYYVHLKLKYSNKFDFIVNIIFYLILTCVYYSKVAYIIYSRILGDTLNNLFLYINGNGFFATLNLFSISYIQLFFILFILLVIYLILFFYFYYGYKVINKNIQKLQVLKFSKSINIAVFLLVMGYCVIFGIAFFQIKTLFTLQSTNRITNQRYAFFAVANNFAIHYINQQMLYTPNEKLLIQKIKNSFNNNYKKEKTHPLISSSLPVPIISKKNQKNIIVFVIDTLRYDIFYELANKNKWLSDFINSNVVFKNHYSGGNISADAILGIVSGTVGSSFINNSYVRYNYVSGKNIIPLYTFFARSIIKNFPKTRQIFGGAELSYVYSAIPKIWYRNLIRLQKNKEPGGKLVHLWDEVAGFFNMLNDNDQSPFFVYFQPQLLHGYESKRMDYPVPYIKQNMESLTSKKIYNRNLNALQTTVLALQYMVEELKRRKLYDNTIIILTSDHGEFFGDFGLHGHGQAYNKTLLHVPLVIHWPGKKHHVYTHRTSHYDLVPTLLKHYFKYKGDLSYISIGKDLFNTKKEWNYLPVTSWIAGYGLYMYDNNCFRFIERRNKDYTFVEDVDLAGCDPYSHPTGVNKKSINKLLYYINFHSHGMTFEKIIKEK